MLDGDLRTDVDQVFRRHAELRELGLRLDGSSREMAAHRLRRVLHLGKPDAELQRRVAVLFLGTLSNDLAVLHAENRDRHMLASVVVDARHPDFLCDNT